jgi:hypothetical protein
MTSLGHVRVLRHTAGYDVCSVYRPPQSILSILFCIICYVVNLLILFCSVLYVKLTFISFCLFRFVALYLASVMISWRIGLGEDSYLFLWVPVTVHREQSMKREKPTRCNMYMFIINFCLNMFRASLCPSSGEQRLCYCVWCVVLVLLDVVASGCGALSCRM